MTAYNELYINDAKQNLGDMIDYAVNDSNLEPDNFFDLFISSGIAKQFEKGNPKYLVGMSGYELAQEVLKKSKTKYKIEEPSYRFEKSKEYWAGWILAYYQRQTGQSFEEMVRYDLKLTDVISMYILHEADVSKFTETANEIIRKNKLAQKTVFKQIKQGLNEAIEYESGKGKSEIKNFLR